MTYVEFTVSPNETIRNVSFKHSGFYPVQKNSASAQSQVLTRQKMSDDDFNENVNPVAKELAKSMTQNEMQKTQRKYDQDLQQAIWENRQEFNQQVADLRSSSRILDGSRAQ